MPPRTEIDHLAFLTWDTAATHEFYVEVLGWPLVVAIGDPEGDPPTIITGYDAGPFTIEFKEEAGLPRASPSPAGGFPHVGLPVAGGDEVAAWKTHLGDHDVPTLDVRDQVWFADPNGVSFQVFPRGAPTPTPAEAQAVLRAWADRS